MKIKDMLVRKIAKRTRGKNYVLLYMLFAAIVACGMSVEIAYAQEVYYPFLKLDVSNRNAESQTEPGFTSFTLLDSGSEFDGVTVELAPTTGTLDARWRGTPTGIDNELIYRDFVFARPGGMRLTLSGLQPNETYEITIYAYDSMSAGDRIADWSNVTTGEFLLTTSFTGGLDPTSADSHAFRGVTVADENGTIILECGPNENTVEESGASNPYAFINALVVASTTPVTKSRQPEPEDGAIVTTTSIELHWLPGMTSISSNVYIGESYDDVNDATTADTDIFRGNTEATSFAVGSAGNPYPNGLVERTTYYWRIDEVEENGTAYHGDVWSFTVAPRTAFNPIPVDGSVYIDPNLTLSWIPGAGSRDHHVYFGDNLEDVQAGTGGTDKGIVAEPNLYVGLLEHEKTYYWRVDESDGLDVFPGEVWSFTTTLENLGTVVMDMWEDIAGSTLDALESDIRYPGSPSTTQMLTSFGTADSIGDNYGAKIYGWLYVPISGDYTFFFTCADEGQLWLSIDDSPQNVQLLASEPVWGWYDTFSHRSDPVSLVSGNKYYIEAIWKEGGDWDHCQVAWQGAGIRNMEIINGSFLSPFLPLASYGAVPISGSVDVQTNTVLRWLPGVNAETHNVYLGTVMDDINDVNVDNLADYPDVTFANVSESSFTPDLLDFNTAYYWRVDDLNSAQPDMVWRSDIFDFITGNYLVIDSFDAYNDLNVDEEGSNRIYLTWTDGFDNPSVNGGTIGYLDPDFANGEHFVETRVEYVHGGNQSGPLLYNNTTASYSQVSLSSDHMPTGSDWAQKGIDTLSLWFFGDPNSPDATGQQLYVKVNDAKVVYEGDVADLTGGMWIQWDIPLSDFGIDMTNVMQLSVGVERTGVIGTEGILFMDDIRLYKLEE
jgi:hypothetical protein